MARPGVCPAEHSGTDTGRPNADPSIIQKKDFAKLPFLMRETSIHHCSIGKSHLTGESILSSVKSGLASLAVGVSFAVALCGTGTALAATTAADSEAAAIAAPAALASTTKPVVVVTGKDVTINGVRYTPQQFQRLLDAALAAERRATTAADEPTVHAAFAPALAAGAYFVPGVGEVLLAATGAIIIGGVTIWGANWIVTKIKNYLANSGQAHEISDARNAIPGYIKNSDGNVDVGKFKTRVRGSGDRVGPKGWKISPDQDGHRGSTWKVLDPKGNRKASVKDNGEIVGK